MNSSRRVRAKSPRALAVDSRNSKQKKTPTPHCLVLMKMCFHAWHGDIFSNPGKREKMMIRRREEKLLQAQRDQERTRLLILSVSFITLKQFVGKKKAEREGNVLLDSAAKTVAARLSVDAAKKRLINLRVGGNGRNFQNSSLAESIGNGVNSRSPPRRPGRGGPGRAASSGPSAAAAGAPGSPPAGGGAAAAAAGGGGRPGRGAGAASAPELTDFSGRGRLGRRVGSPPSPEAFPLQPSPPRRQGRRGRPAPAGAAPAAASPPPPATAPPGGRRAALPAAAAGDEDENGVAWGGGAPGGTFPIDEDRSVSGGGAAAAAAAAPGGRRRPASAAVAPLSARRLASAAVQAPLSAQRPASAAVAPLSPQRGGGGGGSGGGGTGAAAPSPRRSPVAASRRLLAPAATAAPPLAAGPRLRPVAAAMKVLCPPPPGGAAGEGAAGRARPPIEQMKAVYRTKPSLDALRLQLGRPPLRKARSLQAPGGPGGGGGDGAAGGGKVAEMVDQYLLNHQFSGTASLPAFRQNLFKDQPNDGLGMEISNRQQGGEKGLWIKSPKLHHRSPNNNNNNTEESIRSVRQLYRYDHLLCPSEGIGRTPQVSLSNVQGQEEGSQCDNRHDRDSQGTSQLTPPIFISPRPEEEPWKW